jgi:hypothetical protein
LAPFVAPQPINGLAAEAQADADLTASIDPDARARACHSSRGLHLLISRAGGKHKRN